MIGCTVAAAFVHLMPQPVPVPCLLVQCEVWLVDMYPFLGCLEL